MNLALAFCSLRPSQYSEDVRDTREFEYKVTDYYYPEYDRTLIWNDKTINIMWPFYAYWGYGTPTLSEKDEKGQTLDNCETYDKL